MGLADRTAQLRRDLSWRLRDAYDRWKALPLRTRASVALGLTALMAVCLSLSLWLFLSRGRAAHDGQGTGEVVLYTSADLPVARPIVDEFERTTGLKVLLVTDTEATKTTGLVQRLLAERQNPRADVWWSNEALGTIALSNEGLLDPVASRAEMDMRGRWPAHLRATDRTWYGFAQRARVIAYNSNRVSKANAPTRLRDLADSQWHGKVGMARPQFGTTRMHIAALVALHGADATREFLVALRDNGLRLYDGNSAVVQALSAGEIEVGLTDTDDVLAAGRNQWPVEMIFETPDKPNLKIKGLPSAGPLIIPSTVGLIRGCPHPAEARRLMDFLLGERAEELLALGDARALPIRPDLAKRLNSPEIPDSARVSPEQIGRHLAQADAIIGQVFALP